MELRSGPTQYVPVLRWKPAEVGALSKLTDTTWDHITPVLELCPTMFVHKDGVKRKECHPKNVEDILLSRIEELSRAVMENPLFIDLRHLPESLTCSDGEHIWDAVVKTGTPLGLKVIPVSGFYDKGVSNQAKISEAVQAFGNGVAIRLFRKDFEKQSHLRAIPTLLEMLKTDIGHADLLVDLELVSADSHLVDSLITRIPQVNDWRNVTIIAGSFPLDLRHLKANDVYELDRYEFKLWNNHLRSLMQSRCGRTPSFGDYTIQHPFYNEPVKTPHVSASIRYYTPESWTVFRGEWIGKKSGAGCGQYPAEAKLLMERPEYAGEDFSFGDKFIAEKARNGSDHPGGPTQWLLAGINHHITLTAKTIELEPIMTEGAEITVPIPL